MSSPPPRLVVWRPSAPRTLGTLAVVFGWIMATFALLTVVSGGRVGGGEDDVFTPEALAAFEDATRQAALAMAILMAAMSFTLIAIGNGLRRYERWTVRAAARWSIGALYLVGALAYVSGAVIGPAAVTLYSSVSDPEQAAVADLWRWAGLSSVTMCAPFPVVLLGFLRRPGFVAALDQPRRA